MDNPKPWLNKSSQNTVQNSGIYMIQPWHSSARVACTDVSYE